MVLRLAQARDTMNDGIRISLEGAPNFRDMGGYEAGHGQSMKRGVLFRSGELSRLTGTDLEGIRKIGFKTIIDLRTPNERKPKPGRLSPNDTTLLNIPFYPGTVYPGRLKRFLMMLDRRIDYETLTKAFYHRIAFEHKAQIGRVMDIISVETNLPALIHCTGGKDRTGILSALIQLLLGVSREDVVKDYMLTNDLLASYIEDLFKKHEWLKLFHLSIERMRPLFEARRNYLEEVLDRVLGEYGTIEGYLETGCRVDRETVARVRNLLRVRRC